MEKKLYSGIDLVKIFCALLIVYMHSYCFESGWGWISTMLSPVGVPFFFIASGFFFTEGLKKAEEPKIYFNKYFKRVTFMYFAWAILSLPVAWHNLCIVHFDYSVLLKVIYQIRSFIFSGSLGVYWFLLAIIYNCIILYVVYIKHAERYLVIVAILFFVIGVLYAAGDLNGTALGTIIHAVFGSERNFLNVGLFYMSIGYFWSFLQREVPKWFLAVSILCFAIQYVVQDYMGYHVMHVFSAIFLFLFAYSYNPSKMKGSSFHIRKISTAVYLGHSPFILLFDYYLEKGTLIDFTLAVLFSLGLYALILFLFPKKISSILYG